MNKSKLVTDMSNEDYHAHKAISRSALWEFKQLPYKYWYKYLSGQYVDSGETIAMKLGTLCHTIILEPELFEDNYHVMDKVNKATKAGKAAYAEAVEEANGKIIINVEEFEVADAMRKNVYANEIAKDVLTGGKAEQTIFWTDSKTGIQLKARPDSINGAIVSDVKTTLDAGYRGFQRAAYGHGYFLQSAMITEGCIAVGLDVSEFVFLCVEKKPPYSVAIYRLDEEALDYGKKLLRNLLDDYKKCLDSKSWPGYGIQTLLVPKYAQMENEYEQNE